MKNKLNDDLNGRFGTTMAGILVLLFSLLLPASAPSAQSSDAGIIDSSDTTVLPEPLGAESPADNEQVEIIIEKKGRDEYSTAELKDKYEKFSRMHRAGMGLLGAGIPMLAGGLIMYISGLSMASSYDYDDAASGAVLAMFGSIMVSIGPEFVAAGAVLGSIGGKKRREYERRLRVRLGGNSLSLMYDF